MREFVDMHAIQKNVTYYTLQTGHGCGILIITVELGLQHDPEKEDLQFPQVILSLICNIPVNWPKL